MSDKYCHGIVNCKYYDGYHRDCTFMSMGSGDPDDMPCRVHVKSDYQNTVSKFNIDSLKGYESPIEVMFRDIENRIREQEENAITTEVSRQMAINVDKDELTRALMYDRGQYEKGFADAERQYHKIAHWRQTEEPCHWDTIECAECSNCGHSFIVNHEYWDFDEAIREMKYCSQCGAEMSEEPEYAEEETDEEEEE